MNGLLDTDGKLHKCNAWEHLDKAFSIVKKLGVSVSNKLEAEEYLQKSRYHLTDAQKKWLNKNYEYMTNECRKSVDMMFEMNK